MNFFSTFKKPQKQRKKDQNLTFCHFYTFQLYVSQFKGMCICKLAQKLCVLFRREVGLQNRLKKKKNTCKFVTKTRRGLYFFWLRHMEYQFLRRKPG